MQHGNALGDGADEVHVVLDDDHGVLALQRKQQLCGAVHLLVCHTCDRLVDQQQMRILHQQHADLEPLLLAVRECAGLALGLLLESDDAQDLVDAVALLAAEPREQCREDAFVAGHRELEVLEHTVRLEDRRLLELATDAERGDLGLGESQQIDGPPEIGAARIRAGLAGDDVHHGRLAGPVRADHAAQLAGVDVKIQVIDRLKAIEADADVFQIEDHALADIQIKIQHGVHEAPLPVLAHGLAQLLDRFHGAASAADPAGDRDRRQVLIMPTRPAMPLGRKSVTMTKSAPRAKSHASGKAPVK